MLDNFEEEDKPLIMAERMPAMQECVQIPDEASRRKCTEKMLIKYIYDHLTYPRQARENDIEGTTVLSFVVSKSGKIEDIKILRDIGGRCGIAAMDAIKKLPVWSPGKQNGRPVKVIYTIPIKFQIIN
jgi:protein TonB